MARRKAKIKAKITKTMEEKQIGSEPIEGAHLTSFDILRAYNSYNYFHSFDDAKEWAIEWAKTNRPKIVSKIEKCNQWSFPNNVGWIARMLMRGCTLPEHTMTYFERELARIAPAEEKQASTEKAADPGYKENQWIAELETEYDKILLGESVETTPENWFRARQIPQYQLKEILDYYEPMIAEIDVVQQDRSIGSCLSRPQAKVMKQWLQGIVDAINAFSENKKRQRKPRKTRAKKPDQILKNFRYLKECNELNVASINPENLLGATIAYVFNVKSRTLIKLVAAPDQKFTINRTAIVGYDPDKSVVKTIRKPNDVIPNLMRKTKREYQKIFEGINSKPRPINTGRLGDECLILAAWT